jgi:hypothetical protein
VNWPAHRGSGKGSSSPKSLLRCVEQLFAIVWLIVPITALTKVEVPSLSLTRRPVLPVASIARAQLHLVTEPQQKMPWETRDIFIRKSTLSQFSEEARICPPQAHHTSIILNCVNSVDTRSMIPFSPAPKYETPPSEALRVRVIPTYFGPKLAHYPIEFEHFYCPPHSPPGIDSGSSSCLRRLLCLAT